MRFADASSAKSWSRDSSMPLRVSRAGSGLSLATLRFAAGSHSGALAGKRLLFFTDLHVRTAATYSAAPFKGGCLAWRGLDWIFRALHEAVELSKPDYLVFGGDLVVHSSWLEPAMHMLAGLGRGIPKLAVFGNWDKRRRRWLPHSVWGELYAQAGYTLLVNESLALGPFRFFGFDDFKMGLPHYNPPKEGEKELFNCVLAHNPDAVLRSLSDADLAGIDLILCGHTHGGQWRLPMLGALFTSSRHWKCFEKGLYIHKGGRARMLVSSGIGATAFRSRLNCPPEAILIEFA